MKGLLFSQMDPPPGWEEDFHDWYETEHIPARMALPGFTDAVRYEASQGTPRWLACYFLADLDVLDAPEYRTLKSHPSERTARMLNAVSGFTRYTCTELSDTDQVEEAAGALSVVAFSVPEHDRSDFQAWYSQEHVPLLMQADGWLRVRRYTVQTGHVGPAWTHLALHELRDAAVLEAPERERARTTPWRDRLAEQPWFGDSGRWLYRPIHRAVSTTHLTIDTLEREL